VAGPSVVRCRSIKLGQSIWIVSYWIKKQADIRATGYDTTVIRIDDSIWFYVKPYPRGEGCYIFR
jgi:hypothetical protein